MLINQTIYAKIVMTGMNKKNIVTIVSRFIFKMMMMGKIGFYVIIVKNGPIVNVQSRI